MDADCTVSMTFIVSSIDMFAREVTVTVQEGVGIVPVALPGFARLFTNFWDDGDISATAIMWNAMYAMRGNDTLSMEMCDTVATGMLIRMQRNWLRKIPLMLICDLFAGYGMEWAQEIDDDCGFDLKVRIDWDCSEPD